MAHSDDTGLVLPPALAPIQVVLTPIWKGEAEKTQVLAYAETLRAALADRVRVHLDDREGIKPGAKYYEWERKGVPLRLEIGPRDMARGGAFAARRIGGGKFPVPAEGILERVLEILRDIQAEMYATALARRDARMRPIEDYETFKRMLDEEGGFFLVPWRDDPAEEAAVKEETRATIRCYPLDGQEEARGRVCFKTGRPATHMAIFARAY
jgi:prolyl-tRNA synthetase